MQRVLDFHLTLGKNIWAIRFKNSKGVILTDLRFSFIVWLEVREERWKSSAAPQP